jgi:RNase P/RNase MRP subunit p29
MGSLVHGLAIFLVVSLVSGSLPAQGNREESWENLGRLKSNQQIEVIDQASKSYRGIFISFTEQTLKFRADEKEIMLPRSDVVWVQLREAKRGRNALIGMAIGAAAATAVGAAIGAGQSESGEEPFFILLSLPIGIGAGAAVGAAIPSYPVIYRRAAAAAGPTTNPERPVRSTAGAGGWPRER